MPPLPNVALPPRSIPQASLVNSSLLIPPSGFLVESKNKTNIKYFFEIKTEPWEFIRFEKNKKGSEEFKIAVGQLGFSFTKEEEEMWTIWMNKFEQEEESK